jgi:anti-sigma factor ChrR (cupin superfamily)
MVATEGAKAREQGMAGESSSRRIIATAGTEFLPYDLDGPLQPDIGWLPISFDRKKGEGSYLMRMQSGAVTIPHEHPGFEEFIILDGELIDSDGKVFRKGDFISFQPGTRHNSRTETGCLIAVFEWRP